MKRPIVLPNADVRRVMDRQATLLVFIIAAGLMFAPVVNALTVQDATRAADTSITTTGPHYYSSVCWRRDYREFYCHVQLTIVSSVSRAIVSWYVTVREQRLSMWQGATRLATIGWQIVVTQEHAVFAVFPVWHFTPMPGSSG